MACDRRCYDKTNRHFRHSGCVSCPGRDDGTDEKTRMSDWFKSADDFDNICERCIDYKTDLAKAPCKKCIHYAG